MFKVSLRNLFERKLRLLLTFLAISLGVGFMSGTLVLTATITQTFDDLFADVNRGTDAFVRAPERFSDSFGEVARPRIDVELAEEVADVETVAESEPFVQGYARIIDKDGEPIGDPNFGAPTFGGNWGEVDELNPFDLVEGGRPPKADDEVVIDKRTADETGYEVGDIVRVETPTTPAGEQEYELVGIARFGTADSPGGATYALFTLENAMLRVTEPGKVDAIGVVAEDGVAQETVAADVQDAVGDDLEVLTGEEITEENQDDIRQGFSFFTGLLQAFAWIALFVGFFVIYNSFAILIAQRSREMGLLRAIGASRAQVLRAVLFEALVVGLLASALGVAFGVVTAAVLKSALDALGFDIPASGLVLTADTIIRPIIIGTLVTVFAAVWPAFRASRVPPLAALRDIVLQRDRRVVLRVVIASVVLAAGVWSIISGLGEDKSVAAVGIGVVLTFVAAFLYGPAFSRPAALLVGAPLPRLRGVTGKLARENAARNPRRTAATAFAVLLGIGIITFFLTMFASMTSSVDDVIDDQFRGDLVIDSGTFGFGGLPTDVTEQVRDIEGVDHAAGIRFSFVEIEGSSAFPMGVDPEDGFDLLDFDVREGSAEALEDPNTIAVFAGRAEDKDWSLGDEVEVVYAEAGAKPTTIAMIFGNKELAGDYILGTPTLDANEPTSGDSTVYIDLAEGVTLDDVEDDINGVTDAYASAELLDVTEYKAQFQEQFNGILMLILVLLLIAVVIAVLGIVNTLALSVIERTREIGLTRAVGGTRQQVRSIVRWESVIVTLIGTFCGLGIGVFFGWCLTQALEEDGLTTFVVPVPVLAFVVLLAAGLGLVAAVYPAWRAGRLNVLEAIFDE